MSVTTQLKECINLADIIYGAGERGISQQDIIRKMSDRGFGIDQRTFHRKRQMLEEIFDIDVQCLRKGADSRYYISNDGESTANKMAVTCINSFLMRNCISEERFPKDRIYINANYANQHTVTVADAINRSRTVLMTYEKKGTKLFPPDKEDGIPRVLPVLESKTLEFCPYAMAYTVNWYVFGKELGYDDLRVYNLGNIKSMEVTGNEFSSPETFSYNDIAANPHAYVPIPEDLNDLIDDRMGFTWAREYPMQNRLF